MKYRLVGASQERFVNSSISIITNLPDSGLGVNLIIKQTSGDRSHIIETIKFLQKGGLVVKDKASHGKLRKVRLTKFGLSLNSYLHSIDNYLVSYSELRKKYNEIEKAVKQNKTYANDEGEYVTEISLDNLTRAGWTPDEINQAERWFLGLGWLVQESHRLAVYMFLLRFAITINKFDMNEISLLIVQKIMAIGLTKQLKLLIAEKGPIHSGIDKENLLEDIVWSLYLGVEKEIGICFEKDVASCRFIRNEFLSFITSLIDIGDSSGFVSKTMVSHVKSHVNILRKRVSNKPTDENKLLLKNNMQLLDLYEKKIGPIKLIS